MYIMCVQKAVLMMHFSYFVGFMTDNASRFESFTIEDIEKSILLKNSQDNR